MARRRKRRTLRPRVPSRVKRRKRGGKKAEGHQHPELIGLGLLALGVFLGFVVWAGWNGGYVGLWIGEGLDALIGSATLGPAGRARDRGRADGRPQRPRRRAPVPHRASFVLACGLMITLGKDQGGYVGHAARRRARAGDRLDRSRDRRDPDLARRRPARDRRLRGRDAPLLGPCRSSRCAPDDSRRAGRSRGCR